MMDEIACRVCLAVKQYDGAQIHSEMMTLHEFVRHLEEDHGICIQRKGESKKEAKVRFLREEAERGNS